MSTRNIFRTIAANGLLAALAFGAGPETTGAMRLNVNGGAASFVANTNVPAVSIKGKSTAMKAEVSASRSDQGMVIEHIEAIVPVKTLQTGMGVRDEHMRKYIFTTPDGQTPDVVFKADNVTCPATQGACSIAGSLAIRGVARPFSIALKVREEGGGFKVSGESTVKLSDYGIEQPTQFGVKTENAVAVRLEFNARPAAPQVALSGGPR